MIKSTGANSSLLNVTIWTARVITGLLFIFSGLIKANDPLGFSYKLEEYFHVFSMPFLTNFSVLIAIVLCSIEIILGACLLLGIWRNRVLWGLLLLILFFTFLTFYSAFFEVVSSCGCFGDAIPLTPWQSFSKDIALLLLIVFLFINRMRIQTFIPDAYTRNIVGAGIAIVSIGFGVYTYNFLPIIDFLPYKKGNHLPSLMTIPEGATLDEYETTYHLKNKDTGEEKTLTDKEYVSTGIWKEEAWEIIGEPATRLVKAGYQAPVSDLIISDSEGIDRTQEIIENPNNNLIIVAYDLNKTNTKGLIKLNDLAKELEMDYKIRSIILTASTQQRAEELSEELGLSAEFLYADAVPLKSMVRSNPGLMLLKNGTVLDKWSFHLAPSFDQLNKKYFHK